MSDNQETIQQLQTQLAECREQLTQARQQAETASRAKSAFIANLSHEIRTPMNAIVGLTWMLQEQASDPEQKARLQQVADATQQLLAVINDLLDISRIESAQLTLEPLDFDLRQVVNHIVANHAGKAAQKGLAFLVKLPPELPALLRGDPVRLGQILGNFVSNAIKFTDHGTVRLQLDLKPAAEATRTILYCTVDDSGIGIAASQCAQLFQPFAQADPSTKRRFGGTGLGLAISKRLADMMGGRIGVNSQAGQGSSFWLEIPLTVVIPAVLPAGQLSPAMDWKRVGEALQRLEGLLAEDDIQSITLWREMSPILQPALGTTAQRLEGELTAYNFAEALSIVRTVLSTLPGAA